MAMATKSNGNGPERTFRPVPFDYLSCGPSAFPHANEVDESALSKALVDVGAKYVLSATDKKPLLFFLEQVKGTLKIMRDADMDIGEVNVVGAFAKGTTLSLGAVNEADVLVIVKSLPTAESLIAKANQFREALKSNTLCDAYAVEERNYGFDVRDQTITVRVKFTVPANLLREHNPELHIDFNLLMDGVKTSKRTPWFIHRAKRSPLENFTRILLDVKSRFPGLQLLDDWHLELYAYHSLSGTAMTGQPVSLAQAFKRFFQLFAGGALLPNAPTLADPVSLPGPATPLTSGYSLEQMDIICQTAQAICRMILMGRFYEVLGLLPIHEGDPLMFNEMAYNRDDDPSFAAQ